MTMLDRPVPAGSWPLGGPALEDRRRTATRTNGIPRVSIAVGILTLLGLALRLAATGGDLGLDEVWSLHLVARIHSLGQVFWGISHDNNHFLNSAWLFLIGPDRPIWLDRLPAVLFGVCTVPATARWLGRHGAVASLVGAAMAAVALPLVDFGSEARGYAGLALATVLALDARERALDAALVRPDPASFRRWSWLLGVATGFGCLSHLTMGLTALVLVAATGLDVARHTRRWTRTVALTIRLFVPAAVLTLPTAAALITGYLVTGGWTVGDSSPFTLGHLAQGLGGMVLLMSGVSDIVPGLIGLLATLLIVGVAMRRGLLTSRSVHLAVASLLILPLGLVLARVPNVEYARYFLICGVTVLGLEAEILGRLWARGGAGRRCAAILVVGMAVCSLTLDILAIATGRGGFSATAALIGNDGDLGYATNYPVMTTALFDSVVRNGAGRPLLVRQPDLCRDRPRWYIAVGVYDTRPDGTQQVGSPACQLSYRQAAAFAASPMSGTQWTVYRRD